MVEQELLMTIPDLVEAVKGTCICNYSPVNGFSSVAIDSRNVIKNSLFVPLMGKNQDGHVYFSKALEAGASIIFVDEEHGNGSSSVFAQLAKPYKTCVIQVENTLTALQDAARFYVNQFPQLVKIGITGSSGKTTTKEILASILSQHFSVVMNEGNLNSETGLPLSVFNIRKNHQIGVFELGMNRKNEIAEITRVLKPNYAVVTNIGTAHIGILGTQEAIAEEKKSIFSFFNDYNQGFIPEDEKFAPFLSKIKRGTIHTYGIKTSHGFESYEDKGIDGTLIKFDGITINLLLPGLYNLKNALAAIAVAKELGCNSLEIKAGIEAVKPLFGRSQVRRGAITLFIDCYNANPESMEESIDFCSSLDWKHNKIFVLGSMLELGDASKVAHARICKKIAFSQAQFVFLLGKEMIDAAQTIDWQGKKVFFTELIDEIIEKLPLCISCGDLVLIKGSRGLALERILPTIEPLLKENHHE